MTRLAKSFFERDTTTVARNLLGQVLVHALNGTRVSGRIVETEAYTGWDDLASHGRVGKTQRNLPMFGPVGVSYVYLTYGIHWLLNVVAKPPDVDYPAAVLIRAVEPLEGLDVMASRREGRKQREWTSGPGRLTVAMGIGQHMNQHNMLSEGSLLYFEEGIHIPNSQVSTGPRIGINVKEPWQSIEWRFWIKDNSFVSK